MNDDSIRRSDLPTSARVVAIGFLVTVAVLSAFGLLLTHVVAHGVVGHADAHATRWLSQHRSPAGNTTTEWLSRSADTLGAIGIAVIVAIVFAIKRYWRVIATLFLGLAVELLSFLTVNKLVNRPRPHVAHLGSVPSTSSFPSGHTAATFVIYVTVALFVTAHVAPRAWHALAWLAAVVMPLAVGFARVYRGMHNPLDVAGGLLLGSAAVVVAHAAFAARRENAAGSERSIPVDEERAVA